MGYALTRGSSRGCSSNCYVVLPGLFVMALPLPVLFDLKWNLDPLSLWPSRRMAIGDTLMDAAAVLGGGRMLQVRAEGCSQPASHAEKS